MNLINFEEPKKPNINKRKLIIFILIILFIIIILLYCFNKSFRGFFDTYILRKEIIQNNTVSIPVDTEDSQYVYAYSKYITVLSKNVLYSYVGSGNLESKLDVSINNPIFNSSNNFLVVAENNGNKLYLISDSNIIWQNTIEGNISKISVNKNGYVSVIITGTSYKNVIITFDANGKELFKTYLSATTAIATDISNDNKYLAIAEIDTSGTLIQSCIKIISIQKAQEDPPNSVIYKYQADNDNLIINIKYQDKNKLICIYNNSINIINNENVEKIIDLQENKSNIADINLKNCIVYSNTQNSGLFNTVSKITITNIQNNNINTYEINSTIKSLTVHENTIAINLGSEVHFIGLNGWLIKKYISYQEVNNIILGSNIAGIVYRDKIEVINL